MTMVNNPETIIEIQHIPTQLYHHRSSYSTNLILNFTYFKTRTATIAPIKCIPENIIIYVLFFIISSEVRFRENRYGNYYVRYPFNGSYFIQLADCNIYRTINYYQI
jgi:hypothetical protein